MSAVYEDIVKFVANNLKCSICFNVFTQPVTLFCGHNYCHKCINESLTSSAKRHCPLCRKDIDNGTLQKNFTLGDILELQHLGGREIWEFVAETDQDYKTQHAGRTVTKVESLMKRLDWLKAEIKKTEDTLSAELNSNKDCENVSMDGSSLDSEASSCYTDRSFSLTSDDHQESPSQNEEASSQDFIEEDPENSDSLIEDIHIPSAGAEEHNSFAEAALHPKFVKLSFSPRLGNRRLLFCSENRSVSTPPRNQVRSSQGSSYFDACQWMAEQEFREGWLYWDVVTTFSTGWAVGVAYSSLTRSDRLGRTSSSWCLEWSCGQLSAWHNNIKTSVKHNVPNGIRVILDMAKGQLCFQSLSDNLIVLYSFEVNFSDPVRPVFWLYGLSQNVLVFPTH